MLKVIYAINRVMKIKKSNLREVLSKVIKDVIFMFIVYVFFIFKIVFQNSKIQEEILEKGKDIDLQSVDNSKELISILSIMETSFLILGSISLIVYVIYTIIGSNKNFLISKEDLFIKKLNGGTDISISLDFTLEQILELPLIIFISLFFSKHVVMKYVLTIKKFWLFNGLTTSNLNMLSKEIILCTLIPLFLIVAEILISTYLKVRKL